MDVTFFFKILMENIPRSLSKWQSNFISIAMKLRIFGKPYLIFERRNTFSECKISSSTTCTAISLSYLNYVNYETQKSAISRNLRWCKFEKTFTFIPIIYFLFIARYDSNPKFIIEDLKILTSKNQRRKIFWRR